MSKVYTNTLTSGWTKAVLWCDGLQEETATATSQKCEHYDSDDDFEKSLLVQAKKVRPTREDRERKVQGIVNKSSQGTTWFKMQLCIWVEMIVGGMYSSKDDPLNTTMFVRAGGRSKKSGEQSSPT